MKSQIPDLVWDDTYKRVFEDGSGERVSIAKTPYWKSYIVMKDPKYGYFVSGTYGESEYHKTPDAAKSAAKDHHHAAMCKIMGVE